MADGLANVNRNVLLDEDYNGGSCQEYGEGHIGMELTVSVPSAPVPPHTVARPSSPISERLASLCAFLFCAWSF